MLYIVSAIVETLGYAVFLQRLFCCYFSGQVGLPQTENSFLGSKSNSNSVILLVAMLLAVFLCTHGAGVS